ncbi:asialoglycoprotein receptor 1-like [Megalobrama amblycephala]|uniref:asialoglycoprotein receptor 1-like n=1 Tax=Megalobrama amblycephala TaxID=75352 RepID=UPI002014311E|nr:asialoglycoprotein receptor 1-like [Megalobrama amblycephala]
MEMMTGISTDNIYENDDVTSGKFEKDSSELTGAEGVKNRSSRAAAVCLMLLCVLLLTAVIVLCVMFTGERQRLISKNDNLTDERDQLISMFTQERQKFISKNDNLTNQRDQLMFMNKNLTRERDQLKQEKSDLQRSLDKMDGWTYYHQSSFYFISSGLRSWNESRRYCRDRGADLIIINNTTELEFVNRISGNISGNTGVWIGLIKVDGRWKWVDDNTLNSESWVSPDGQNCIFCYSTQCYYSLCDDVYRCICERRILPSVLP